MRPVALPPAEPLGEEARQHRMEALLATEYVQPGWGLPRLEDPSLPRLCGAGSPAGSCSQELGHADDALILAALALVLGRYGGVARVALAIPAAGGAPSSPALCVLDVDDATTVGNLLDAAADQLRQPWPQYDEELRRTLSGAEGGGRIFLEACFEPARPSRDFPLTVTVRRTGGFACADVTFQRELFSGPMAAQFVRHVAAVVHRLTGCRPDSPLSSVELLDPIEQEQVLRLGESGRRAPEERRRLDELVAARAAERPDAIALGNQADGLTYRQLDGSANQIARALRARGVLTGSRVAACLPRTAELVAILLGILRAGAAYVPMEPDYPHERLGYMLDNAQPAVVITDLAEFPDSCPILHPAELAGAARLEDRSELPVHGSADDAAYVIYTSGSTGRPKGVAVSHRNVTALIAGTGEDFRFAADDVWALFHSVAFDMSVWEIWGALSTGGRLVIVPSLTSRSPRELHALLAGERVTVLNQTPSAFAQLLEADSGADDQLALRLVTFGGEPLDTRMLVPWFDRHPEHECVMVNLYGITETTVHSTWTTLTRAAASAATREVGTALPGESLSVRDAAGRILPVGVAGEIYVGGVGVALGYLNRPDLTAERFLPDPYTGRRVYRSGDRGRLLPTGRLEHLGRLDNQVKLRGYRIELDEVRAALLSCDGVTAAVAVINGDPADPAAARLDGYVVTDQHPAGIDTAAIRRHTATILPEYMVPATVTALERLPLTANGKLDRARLAPPSAVAGPRPEERPAAAAGDLCTVVRQVWTSLTDLPAGPDDNLFDVGGNSILIGRLVKQLDNQGLPRLPLRQIYLAPTPRQIAALLDSALLDAAQHAAITPA